MQLTTLLSAASAIVATASANVASDLLSAVELNKACDTKQAYARVINRCDYPVHIWSVLKGTGCPSTGMVTLEKGGVYNENYRNDGSGGPVGVSIKISKSEDCKANDIVQLEYFLEHGAYKGNYLDVSYVDCAGGDCPTRKEGYYLKAGNQTGSAAASSDNTWCPILSCHDSASCSKVSYVDPNDVQTKTCDVDSSMDFYMCGGNAPDEEYDSSAPEPASSSEKATSAAPSPTSTKDSYTENYKVNAAAVTNAPKAKEVENPKTKTHVEVVYVTATEYIHAKRHGHGHARRHQAFHA